MNKYNTLVFVITMLTGVLPVAGQQAITFTMDDLPFATGIQWKQRLHKGSPVAVNVGPAGENQIWDFTAYDLPIEEQWESIPSGEAPHSNDFPTATAVFKVSTTGSDTITYNFLRTTETEYFELGQLKQVNGEDVRLVTSYQKAPKVTLPVTYGTAEWSSAPQYEADEEYLGIKVHVIVTDTSHYEIDGWGIVKTPMGDLPCLRVKQHHQMIVTITDLPGLPPLVMENDIIYSWISPGMGFVVDVYSKMDETDDNFTEARQISVMQSFSGLNSVALFHQPLKMADFTLKQNYPNPFNPVTEIRYHLPGATNVVLTVYNGLGEHVETLVSRYQKPGIYRVQWDASQLASGTYYYQLKTASKTVTMRCMLLK